MATAIAGAENARREFDLSDAEFAQVRRLIYEHAGISLSDSKREMVYSRLARRLRDRGLQSFRDYLQLLEQNDAEEWELFTNALTTNLTSFFRESHHFPLLAEHIGRLPAGRPVLLWCAASSTGEEPYSMAMTMVDLYGSFKTPVKILATDVDTNVLSAAASGVYARERVERLTPAQLKRFFQSGTGANADKVRVREELREMVTFRQLNLLDKTWPIRGPFDAIFCRNVMIYFDKDTQYEILRKFVPLMRPEALLFAGHSESFYHAADLFKSRGKTVYEPVAKALARHG
jgi:chemotaxis protein methyltransferase CheR